MIEFKLNGLFHIMRNFGLMQEKVLTIWYEMGRMWSLRLKLVLMSDFKDK